MVVAQQPTPGAPQGKPRTGGAQSGTEMRNRRPESLEVLFERILVIKSSNERFAKSLHSKILRISPFPSFGQSRLAEDPSLMEDLAQLVADSSWPLERKSALEQLFRDRSYDWSRIFAILGKMETSFVNTLEHQCLDDSYVTPATQQRQARLGSSIVRWALDNCTEAAFEEAVRVAEMLVHGRPGTSAVFHKHADRGGYARVLYGDAA